MITLTTNQRVALQVVLLEQLRWFEQVAGVEFVDKFEAAGAAAEVELQVAVENVLAGR